MPSEEYKLVSHEKLMKFSKEVLIKLGLSESDAEIVAESLILANLRGVDSHGVVRLSSYVDRALKGLIKVNAPMTLVKDSEVLAIIDANNGFGQIAAVKAVEIAMDKAKKFGVGVVGVKNANHAGMLAYYTMRIAKNGFIGIMISNAPPAIAPWGGTKPLIGTNPLCIAIPYKETPIVVDAAMTVVARGKIRLYALQGKKIPEGWALDKNGKPTTDPNEALKGSLMPVGGPKGYALALAIDILTGVLLGSAFGWKVKELIDFSDFSRTAFLIIALNIDSFRPYDEFMKDLEEYVKAIKNTPKREDVSEIFLPGEIEQNTMNKRLKEGIPLDEETLEKLRDLSIRFNIPLEL